jgi:Leucine-rich repeat (LRR) protein
VRLRLLPNRWQRYLQFSVRGLIALVLAVGCCVAYVQFRARLSREAINAIIRSGGFVTYEDMSQPGQLGNDTDSSAQRWVGTLLGTKQTGDVAWVNFRRTATDRSLDYVGRLPSIRQLDVTDSAVTDDGLRNLEALKSLNQLRLGGTRISDAGLVHLRGLTQLSSLYLGGTRITDAGLVHLKGLAQLSRLDVGGTRITDAGLAHLKGLTRLSSLDLVGTGVTDAGLPYLSGLSDLRSLTLPQAVSTEGIGNLRAALPYTTVFRGPRPRRRVILHN